MREEFYSSLPSLFRRYPPQGYTSSNPPTPAAPGQQGASLDAEGLRVRVAAFRQQIEAWIGSGRLGVPLLALADAPPPEPGRCVSCGAALEPDECWRCPTCVVAVYLAPEEQP